MMMHTRQIFVLVVGMVLCLEAAVLAEDKPDWEAYSDTWVASDSEGRKLPGYKEVGPVKQPAE